MRIEPFAMGGGFGILALVWIAVIVAFWVLIIAGLFYGVRWLIRADRGTRLTPPPAGPDAGGGHQTGPKPEDPLEVLRLRYARGEIDEEEYERRRRTLTGA